MKIGYQGDIGSNSEAAAKAYFYKKENRFDKDIKNIEWIPLLTSKNVFESLMTNQIDVGVVAIANSLAGEVQETKKALKGINPQCKDTITIPIHHCLFSKNKNKSQFYSECTVVMSHPQALQQTKLTRKEHYSWLKEYEVDDQAKAAKDLSEGHYPENYTVICRKNAGESVGLTLISENIEDDPSNKTTFGIFIK